MCECGAIVVEEGENFQCPSCGLIMTELNAECPRCGEIGGRCPECGKKLSSEDLVCDRCGTEFENV